MRQRAVEKMGAGSGSGRWWICTWLLAAACLASAAAADEGPRREVERALQRGVSILGDPELTQQARIERLREVVLPLFDFPEMARRSLGAHWRRRTPEQREEFIGLFAGLLERTYASRIAAYNGQRMHVVREKIDGGFARVETRIVDREGRRFEVNYRLRRNRERWRIYDIVIENISLVNNYRAQFNRVINRTSYEALVERLRRQPAAR